jgi:hypothetical protein
VRPNDAGIERIGGVAAVFICPLAYRLLKKARG